MATSQHVMGAMSAALLASALGAGGFLPAQAQQAQAPRTSQLATRTRARSTSAASKAPAVRPVPRAATGLPNTRVVLGSSIGRVALGDAQVLVRKKLGTPAMSFQLNNGLSSDLWRSASARRWDGALHTFEVVYRKGVAIQIEATNPAFTTARGLGLKSSDAAWNRAHGKRDESKQYKYVGGKRDQGYDDWIGAGFALEYQFLPYEGQGDPPIQMQTLIVHYKGVPVIPDPGGS